MNAGNWKAWRELVLFNIHVVNKIFASFRGSERSGCLPDGMDSVQSELLSFLTMVYFIAPPLFYYRWNWKSNAME